MFKNTHRTLSFHHHDGLVQAKAKVSLYPDRGDYQLIVSTLAKAGEGRLREAFDKF